MTSALLIGILRLAQLLPPTLLGLLTGRMGLFPSPAAAIQALNLFALRVAFPVLLADSMLRAPLALPREAGFYLMWPLTLLTLLWGLWLMRRALKDELGALALTLSFGNIAYLGLPYGEALYGEGARGALSLGVTLHVVLAVTLAPALLARWSPTDAPAARLGATLAQLVRQPLCWAPLVGLVARAAPDGARQLMLDTMEPLAVSAAPTALFLLGLYLYEQRALLLRRPSWSIARHLFGRMIAAPALALLLALILIHLNLLTPEQGAIHVTLAAMPVAITTFSMAHDANIDAAPVAGAIAWSCALALILLPLWSALAAFSLR